MTWLPISFHGSHVIAEILRKGTVVSLVKRPGTTGGYSLRGWVPCFHSFIVNFCCFYLFFNLVGTDKPHQYSRPCRKFLHFTQNLRSTTSARRRFHLEFPDLRIRWWTAAAATVLYVLSDIVHLISYLYCLLKWITVDSAICSLFIWCFCLIWHNGSFTCLYWGKMNRSWFDISHQDGLLQCSFLTWFS